MERCLFAGIFTKKSVLKCLVIAGFCVAASGVQSSRAESRPFAEWVTTFKSKAESEGVSSNLVERAFRDLTPHQRVIELDRKQPEGSMSFVEYRKKIVNALRIKRGREMYSKHRAKLEEVGARYGIAPQYIVALWGIETNYGSNTGGFDVVQALSTLAWEGRRSAFFTDELLTALKIIDDGHIDLDDMGGSWAGAMGQNQFMPSSFTNFAQDYNNDGRKDIWNSLPDVFASSANYLTRSGWKDGEKWGRQVLLPEGFDKALIGKSVKKPLADWERLGVRAVGNAPLPDVAGFRPYIVAPDGDVGPAYLAYHNFDVIKKWNRSDYFATSVGLLADAIAQ